MYTELKVPTDSVDRFFSADAMLADMHQGEVGVITVLTEITERKQVEEALRQRNAAEADPVNSCPWRMRNVAG